MPFFCSAKVVFNKKEVSINAVRKRHRVSALNNHRYFDTKPSGEVILPLPLRQRLYRYTSTKLADQVDFLLTRNYVIQKYFIYHGRETVHFAHQYQANIKL